jgi:hypothetical protein
MGANPMKDFPVYAPCKEFLADLRKERFDNIHRLAVRVNLHHANGLLSAKPTKQSASLIIIVP